MAEFKIFLAENAHQGFDLLGALTAVEDLLPQTRLVRSHAAIKAFQDSIAEGQLYNTTLTEVKDAVNYLACDAWNKLYYTGGEWYKFDSPIYKALDEADIDVPAYIDAGKIKKAIRTLEAAQKLVTDADVKAIFTKLQRLGTAYAYCIDAFKAVQSKVIKGRRPAAINPNDFHSRMGSAHSVATVRTSLLKSITPPLEEFEEQLRAYYQQVLSSVDKAVAGQTSVKPFKHPNAMMMFQSCYEFKMKGWDDKREHTNIVRKSTADNVPVKDAAAAKKLIEDTFLHKNALKLSALLDAKGNLTSIDVLEGAPVKLHKGAGTLQTSMSVKFGDGSSFIVRNKVIINQSATGKQFYQYPTTFHDVALANGDKLEAPSEEKMLKVFGATA